MVILCVQLGNNEFTQVVIPFPNPNERYIFSYKTCNARLCSSMSGSAFSIHTKYFIFLAFLLKN